MHAFPRRFRTERAAEIEATFHEAELAGERHPYGAHALADVFIAGWTERARSRPPFGAYVKYRMFGGRLESRWHAWMLDDVRGLFSLRRFLWAIWPLAIVLPMLSITHPPVAPSHDAVLFTLVVFVLTATFGGRRDRRRILRLHGYDPETRAWLPPEPMMPLIVRAPRPVRVAPLAFGLAAALGLVFPVAVLGSFGVLGVAATGWWGDATRLVDHQVSTAIAVVAAAAMLAVVGFVARGRLTGLFTRSVALADVDPVYSDPPAAGGLSVIVAAAGCFFSALPASPLIVPWAFVIAAGAIPALIVVGIAARHDERDGVIVMWARRDVAESAPHAG